MRDFIEENWFPISLFGGLGLVLALIFGAAVWDMSRPSFSLAKADWRCTKSHTETGFMMIAGKAPIYVPTTNTVCDQWSRK